jgi:hypothetical protein
VPEVEVGLRAVVGHVDLAVLVRAHRARVDVDVRVELDEGDAQAARLEQRADADADASPLPMDETTPPVVKTYFVRALERREHRATRAIVARHRLDDEIARREHRQVGHHADAAARPDHLFFRHLGRVEEVAQSRLDAACREARVPGRRSHEQDRRVGARDGDRDRAPHRARADDAHGREGHGAIVARPALAVQRSRVTPR